MSLFRFPSNVYDIEKIQRAKVVVCGLGSVGSKFVENIAPLPFREWVLIDPQTLGPENVERHLLGYDELDNPKVNGVARWLINRGVHPNTITTHMAKDYEVMHLHEDADIVICCVDVQPAKEWLNEWCVERNIPLIIASVYAGGIGGQVIVLPDPKNVCFICAKKNLGLLEYAGVPDDTNYGIDPTAITTEDGDTQGVSSLAAPVSLIASHAAIKALTIIGKGGSVPPHALIVALDDWVATQSFPVKGKLASGVSSFIAVMRLLKMMLVWKLDKQGHAYTLWMKDSIFPQMLTQWSECYMHYDSAVDAESI